MRCQYILRLVSLVQPRSASSVFRCVRAFDMQGIARPSRQQGPHPSMGSWLLGQVGDFAVSLGFPCRFLVVLGNSTRDGHKTCECVCIVLCCAVLCFCCFDNPLHMRFGLTPSTFLFDRSMMGRSR